MPNDVCPNRDKAIRGCKFEPRYDSKPPAPEAVAALNLDGFFSADYEVDDVLEQLSEHTYVLDICIRCGKTVQRSR